MQIYIAIFIPPDLAIYERPKPPHVYFHNGFCLKCNIEWFVRENAFEIDFLKQLYECNFTLKAYSSARK